MLKRLASRYARILPALAVFATFTTLAPSRALADGIVMRDDDGQTLRLDAPARRIVSLAPHITELLFAAGAGDRVVGVVAYSDYPPAATALPQVGSFHDLDLEAIAGLRPDLVVAWRGNNHGAQLSKLAALGIPVFISEPRRLDDVADNLEALGRLAGSEATATAAATAFRTRLAQLSAQYRHQPPVRMLYQIWDKPLRTVNGEHLISDVVALCGGTNVFAGLPTIAPIIGVEGVLATDPEAIVASGMDQARPEWLDQWRAWPALTATQRGNLFFIPPQLIQRHTPRILDGATQLCAFLETARARRPRRD